MSRSEFSPIERAVQNNIATHFGKQDNLHFVIGVSGGIDSMSLLYIFTQLSISAHVVHLNYQKRGKASEKDARLVARMAKKWGFDYSIVKANPDEARGRNFQQWARDRRYQLFEELAEKQQATGIAVAHHQDDQLETILQKMFRGGGLASWSGMQVWNGWLFRPLLGTSQSEIQRFAEKNNIPYRTDQSNLESDFARNFLRNEWMAKLSGFFPGWQQNILGIGEQAALFEQSLQALADQITDRQGIGRGPFHELTDDLQKALVLHLLKQKKPGIEVARQSLDQIEKIGDLQTGQSIQLTDDFSLLRDRGHYCITEDLKEEISPVILHEHRLEDSAYTGRTIRLVMTDCDLPEINKEGELLLDAASISWPITVRRWQHGDRFQPLGMEGHQLISDHLTNRKISTASREKALVIESFEETICAVIFPPIKNRTSVGTISEQVKCNEETTRCLKITYSQ